MSCTGDGRAFAARVLPAINPPRESDVGRALSAWFDGDHERVLAILDARPRAIAEEVEARLLRARALLRLGRVDEVEPALGDDAIYTSVDERATAWMLRGSARSRSAAPTLGVVELRALLGDHSMRSMHRSIRAETHYRIAIARWRLNDFAGARSANEGARDASTDIIHVQALALDGYIAAATDPARAIEPFVLALRSYQRAVARDRALEALIVVYTEQFRANLDPQRAASIPTSMCRLDGALAVHGWQVKMHRAWGAAARGDVSAAFAHMRESIALAPTTPFRVQAVAQRAALYRALAQPIAANDVTDEAVALAIDVAWEEHGDAEHHGLLLLAAQVSYFDPPAAAAMVERFDRIADHDRDLTKFNALPLVVAERQVARGIVLRATGDRDSAIAAFRPAQTLFARTGFAWRSATVALEIDRTTASDSDVMIACVASQQYPHGWWLRDLGRWRHIITEPVVRRLSAAEREVLRCIFDGLSLDEIAARRDCSAKTAANVQSRLYDAFGVHSRRELVRILRDRGLTASDDDLGWAFA